MYVIEIEFECIWNNMKYWYFSIKNICLSVNKIMLLLQLFNSKNYNTNWNLTFHHVLYYLGGSHNSYYKTLMEGSQSS